MGEERPETTPEGWYDDPHAPGQQRWWTGTAWGPQTRPGAPPAGGSSKSGGCLIAVVILVILIGVTAELSGGGDSPAAPGGDGPGSTSVEREDTATELDAYAMCKEFVKDRLRAPATAGFPLSYEATITGGPDRWRVESHVDAENGFGANIRSEYRCQVRYLGDDQWRLVSLTIDGE